MIHIMAERVGITISNLYALKNEKAKAIRFMTLDVICKATGAILEYKPDEE